MQRKALILSLAIALVFAAIPGVAAFAFAQSHDGGHATVLIAGDERGTVDPVAFGLDAGGECPGDDTAAQATF